jgi:hypothetical protein
MSLILDLVPAIFIIEIFNPVKYIGKAWGLDLTRPDYIDHPKPELNTCCFVMYVKRYQTGQMWSV